MRRRLVSVVVLAVVAPVAWPVTASAAAATCHGRKATIVGSAQSELLTGTQGNDVIAGLAGSDVINGGGGDDWICGGSGADRLTGGRGDDRLFGDRDRLIVSDHGRERIGDRLQGGAGNDRLAPGRDTRPADDVTHDVITWDASPRRVDIDMTTGVATGHGRDRFSSRATWVTGSAFADVIDGTPGNDLVDGHRGADLIRTGDGDDVVIGGSGADRISTQGGDDQVHAGSGLDLVYGGKGNDELSADEGADSLYGGRGNDTIDNISSGAFAAKMYGERGRDLIVAQLADTLVVGGGQGTGDELSLFTNVLNPDVLPATGTWNMATGALVFDLDGHVQATAGGFERADLATYGASWTIQGTAGSDDMNAVGTSGMAFEALAGDDTFWGSAGDDVFDGAAGTDRSLGTGNGNDTCIDVEVFDVDDCETISP